jgi:hypothetical protein
MQKAIERKRRVISSLRGWARPALVFLVFGLAASELLADTMRCGRKVIRTGDSPAVALEHCGEPRYKGRGTAEIDTADGRQTVKVEQWHYKQDDRSLERIVLVYRGEIVGVETGRR